MAYGDSHRALAQAFLARSIMSGSEAKDVITAILTAEDAEREVDAAEISSNFVATMIGEVNEELSKFDFEIRSMRDQRDRSTIWAFVSTLVWAASITDVRVCAGEYESGSYD